MVLPQRSDSPWLENRRLSNGLFGTGADDYELHEREDGFVLTVEMPGFSVDDIDVAWDEGVLNVSAEREDESRGRRRTYHRRFRFPRGIDDDGISARYENGVLEVSLPVEGASARGRTIEVEG